MDSSKQRSTTLNELPIKRLAKEIDETISRVDKKPGGETEKALTFLLEAHQAFSHQTHLDSNQGAPLLIPATVVMTHFDATLKWQRFREASDQQSVAAQLELNELRKRRDIEHDQFTRDTLVDSNAQLAKIHERFDDQDEKKIAQIRRDMDEYKKGFWSNLLLACGCCCATSKMDAWNESINQLENRNRLRKNEEKAKADSNQSRQTILEEKLNASESQLFSSLSSTLTTTTTIPDPLITMDAQFGVLKQTHAYRIDLDTMLQLIRVYKCMQQVNAKARGVNNSLLCNILEPLLSSIPTQLDQFTCSFPEVSYKGTYYLNRINSNLLTNEARKQFCETGLLPEHIMSHLNPLAASPAASPDCGETRPLFGKRTPVPSSSF